MQVRLPPDATRHDYDIIQWLLENVGPLGSDTEHGVQGKGWQLALDTYEEPYAQVMLYNGGLLIDIDDETKMTAFLLRWG